MCVLMLLMMLLLFGQDKEEVGQTSILRHWAATIRERAPPLFPNDLSEKR